MESDAKPHVQPHWYAQHDRIKESELFAIVVLHLEPIGLPDCEQIAERVVHLQHDADALWLCFVQCDSLAQCQFDGLSVSDSLSITDGYGVANCIAEWDCKCFRKRQRVSHSLADQE